MKDTIKKNLNLLLNGTKTMFKEFFNKETNKKQRANMWTFSRIIISIPILIFSILSIINFSAPLLITNSILVGIGAITDYFDGKSARKHKSTSDFGKRLDQVVDKIFSGIIAGTLSIINPMYLMALVGELIITATTVPFAAKYKEIKDTSSSIGRIKQWPLGVSFFFGYLSPLTSTLNTIATALILISFGFQVATANSYLTRNLETIKEIKNKQNNKILEIENNDSKETKLIKTIGEKGITNNTSNKNLSNKDKIKELETLKKELLPIETTNKKVLKKK